VNRDELKGSFSQRYPITYPSKRAALFTQQIEKRGTKTLQERAIPSRVYTSKKGTQFTH
jgi:hypothetical protein